MSGGLSGGARAVSLEQLVALNDEMAALVRAGVPLEQGLIDLGGDLPGRLGEIATSIGQRMRGGESLVQILARDGKQFPPVWRAVVEAGVRSGRLSAALEGLFTTARRAAEVRRAVGVAWIYPLVVVSLAFVLFVFLVTQLAPATLVIFREFSLSDPLLESLVQIGDWAGVWGVAVPLCLVAGGSLLWYRSGRAVWYRGRSGSAPRRTGWFGHWPSVRQTLWDGRVATFAETLALLVDQRIPLPEAMVLAGEASGDRGLSESSQAIAARLARGELFADRERIPAPLPPLLGWLLVTGLQQTQLSESLRRIAETYRQRAAAAANWNAIYLPIVLTAVVGGAVVLLQALATFEPICRLLYGLG